MRKVSEAEAQGGKNGKTAVAAAEATRRTGELAESANEAFGLFDKDGSGYIEAVELSALATHLGEPFANSSDLDAALVELDSSGDNRVDHAEFVQWWVIKCPLCP